MLKKMTTSRLVFISISLVLLVFLLFCLQLLAQNNTSTDNSRAFDQSGSATQLSFSNMSLEEAFSTMKGKNRDGVPSLAAVAFADSSTTVLNQLTGYGTHGTNWADAAHDDGYPDLYITRYLAASASANERFYVNTGGTALTDSSTWYHVQDHDATHGACWADLDNDGDYDLINGTTTDGSTGLADNNNIYENLANSDFSENTPADMSSRNEKTRMVLALDMNADGDLDIFTVTGYQGTNDSPTEDNEVYLNSLGFAFNGLNDGVLYHAPCCQGATDTDFDKDGDIDIIAANRSGPLNMLRNDGTGTYRLMDPAGLGIKNSEGGDIYSDGISMGDYDNDGDLDMLIVDAVKEIAYLFQKNDSNDSTYTLEDTWGDDLEFYIDGYMGGFADLNNDGYLDIVIAGTSPCFINTGSGTFNWDLAVPLTNVEDPRSIAFADYDNDGDLDFVYSDDGPTSGGSRLIQNNLTGGGNYMKIRLTAPNGQAGAYGAKIYVYDAYNYGGDLLAYREARSGNGYLGQDDPVIHVGLGSNTAADVHIQYLTGETATRTNQSAGGEVTVDRADAIITVQVFLEGCYAAGEMSTYVRDNGDVPLTSPYSEDPRVVPSIPADITDWVLVELRSTLGGAAIASKSAFLRKDGYVVADDGTTTQITLNAAAGAYYVVVRHRNHLDIISDETITLNTSTTSTYNFTTGTDKYEGAEAADLGSGVYGMFAGDPNGTEVVNSGDYLVVKTYSGAIGYYDYDCNLTGVVNSADYLVIKPNSGKSSNIP